MIKREKWKKELFGDKNRFFLLIKKCLERVSIPPIFPPPIYLFT